MTVNKQTTCDTLFNGRLKVCQPKLGYRFSIDAVILAHLVEPKAGTRIVDLGAGCGIVSLLLAFRNQGLQISAVEIQPELARIARENVILNQMENSIDVLPMDMGELRCKTIGGPVDLIVSNPPYRRESSGRINPNDQRAIARHEIKVSLSSVVETARYLLQTKGRFMVIYSAERLADLIFLMRKNSIEPKRLVAIHSTRKEAAKLFAIEGVKAGKRGLKIDAPLFIYNAGGGYTPTVQKMFQL